MIELLISSDFSVDFNYLLHSNKQPQQNCILKSQCGKEVGEIQPICYFISSKYSFLQKQNGVGRVSIKPLWTDCDGFSAIEAIHSGPDPDTGADW